LGYGAAVGLYWSAYDIYQYIDWGVAESMLAALYVTSAVSLSNLLIELPGHWCTLVSGGVCLPSDGFVTTGNQAYPGGVNLPIAGAAHTKQTGDATIHELLGIRVRAILGL
jgi:hypothetical protein